MSEQEPDFFNWHEQEVVDDLAQWRLALVKEFEKNLAHATQIVNQKSKGKLDTSHPDIDIAVRRHLKDVVAEQWREMESSPSLQDYLRVAGPALWYDMDEMTGLLTSHELAADRMIYGSLADWQIMPYYDEALVGRQHEATDEERDEHTVQFGIDLILEDPKFTDSDNNRIPIYIDQIYLPLHYSGMKLQRYIGK